MTEGEAVHLLAETLPIPPPPAAAGTSCSNPSSQLPPLVLVHLASVTISVKWRASCGEGLEPATAVEGLSIMTRRNSVMTGHTQEGGITYCPEDHGWLRIALHYKPNDPSLQLFGRRPGRCRHGHLFRNNTIRL